MSAQGTDEINSAPLVTSKVREDDVRLVKSSTTKSLCDSDRAETGGSGSRKPDSANVQAGK